MKEIIKKWGNSPALRLPNSVLELAHLRLGQAVNINVINGKIVIEPIVSKKTRLDELLAGITPDNIHAEEFSEEDWSAIQETVYLLSIPGMRESIKDAMAELLAQSRLAHEVFPKEKKVRTKRSV
jgi:antitoxin MazE